jgi:hypothetical protein
MVLRQIRPLLSHSRRGRCDRHRPRHSAYLPGCGTHRAPSAEPWRPSSHPPPMACCAPAARHPGTPDGATGWQRREAKSALQAGVTSTHVRGSLARTRGTDKRNCLAGKRHYPCQGGRGRRDKCDYASHARAVNREINQTMRTVQTEYTRQMAISLMLYRVSRPLAARRPSGRDFCAWRLPDQRDNLSDHYLTIRPFI